MRTTIDTSGRMVVPKQLRDRIGLVAGEVDVTVSGSGLLVEPVATDELVTVDGMLMLPAGGPRLTADDVRELRLGDQR